MTIQPEAEPIPHISTATDPFADPGELRQRWRALMGPLGFSEELIWVAFVDNERQTFLKRPLVQIEMPPRPFEADHADVVISRLAEVADDCDDISFALLLTRPGSDGLAPSDLNWARWLREAADRHGVSLHPVHRANDVSLVRLPTAYGNAA